MRERSCPIDVNAAIPKLHPHVAAIDPTQVRKRSRERGAARLQLRIVFVPRHEHADAPHPLTLLCVRRPWPRCRAAKPRDELPPTHLRLQRFEGKPIAIRDAMEPVLIATHRTSAAAASAGPITRRCRRSGAQDITSREG
jgi:hypothetical protein